MEYFAIANDRLWSFAITPLKPISSRQDKDVGCTHFYQISFLVSTNLPTTWVDFHDFQNLHFLTTLKNKPSYHSKVCVKKFEKEKFELTQLFWNISFSNKIKNHWTDSSKVCVIKIWKRKIWVDQIICLSKLIIVEFAFFSKDTIQG